MNAAATVLLAFLRPSLLRLFTPRDNLDSIIPSFTSMGITPFLKYTTASVFVHSLALLSIAFFSLDVYKRQPLWRLEAIGRTGS